MQSLQRRIVWAALAMVLDASNLPAQTAALLNDLIDKRDATVRQLQAGMVTQKAGLFDKYAAALDTVLQQLTAVPPAPETCTYELLDPKTAPKEIGADLVVEDFGRGPRQ